MWSNFCVYSDRAIHEYLTHENLLSWVEFEKFQSKNKIVNINQNMKIRPHKKYPAIWHLNILAYKHFLSLKQSDKFAWSLLHGHIHV